MLICQNLALMGSQLPIFIQNCVEQYAPQLGLDPMSKTINHNKKNGAMTASSELGRTNPWMEVS
jgi:hypothetical protein